LHQSGTKIWNSQEGVLKIFNFTQVMILANLWVHNFRIKTPIEELLKKKNPCTNLFNAISHFKFKAHLIVVSWVLSQVDNLIHDFFSAIIHISQLQMKNVISFLISKFQDLSNGILEAQFGPNFLLPLLFQKFKIHIFKMRKSLGKCWDSFSHFFVVCSNL